MSTSSLSLLDSRREAGSLLPTIMFGYLYSQDNLLAICSPAEHLPHAHLLSPEPVWILVLTAVSIVVGSGVYTISVAEESPSNIYDSAGYAFQKLIWANTILCVALFVLAAIFLLVRICQGDLVINTLLFVWFGIILTTLWSFILNYFTDMDEMRGILT